MAYENALSAVFLFAAFSVFSNNFRQVLAIPALWIGESEGAENPERRDATMKT